MKKIFTAALLGLLYQLFSPVLYGQAIELRDTLTASSGIYAAKPGTKSFYARMWGAGAGGNEGWANGTNGYNGTGGGGGGSYSKTRRIDLVGTNGRFTYIVGTGGGINQNGGDSWIFTNQFIAFGGFVSGQGRKKQDSNSYIDSSWFGGVGGQSFRFFSGDRWQGGGGGSGRINGEAAAGQNASNDVFNKYHGFGGDGTGGGGKTDAYSPGTPGGGGAGNQNGARGEIRVVYTCDYSPGTIGNAHTVPYPAEKPLGTDVITTETFPSLNTVFTYIYSWERSIDNINWTTITGSGANGASYALPELQQDTWFRRVINGCNPDPAKNRSNVVLIKVFRKVAGQKDGTITGRVVSKSGNAGVQGIEIIAQKTINLKGSDSTFKYRDTTDDKGNYSIEGIFYGNTFDDDPGDVYPDDIPFKIYPVKPGRTFGPQPGYFTTTLSGANKTRNLDNFVDSTVYAITGRITQPLCASCLPGSQGPYGVGEVKISTNDLTVQDVFSESKIKDSLGYFGITVLDPKTYIFTPTFLNHKFDSVTRTVRVTGDVMNINFTDTSTREISGKLVDVAGRRIGSAILKFRSVYLLPDSTEHILFQKSDTIVVNDSVYNVRLPAGKYRVSIERFTPLATNDIRFVPSTDVVEFFNNLAIEPIIDISTRDSVRNLIYHRRPQIVITGLNDIQCNPDSTKNPGIVFRTNEPKRFRVTVFEGNPTLRDSVRITAPNSLPDTLADYIRFYTNITSKNAEENADTLYFRLKPSGNRPMIDSFFLPGVPNSIPKSPGDFSKPFEVHYIDRYKRTATPLKPKATVVGVLNPTKTFTTAFPEIPYLILHAPPGDGSYSFWSKDSSTQIATSYSVAKEDGRDGFVNVSLAPTISTATSIGGGEIGFEIQGIATLNYQHEYSVNSNKTDELVETVTAKKRFETVKNPIVTGNSGDVYVGHGTNFILGKSIYLDFIEGKPANACELDTSSRLIMAPKGFRTEFAYAEDHIVKVIIPQQQRLADEATDDSSRAMAKTQVDVWKQVIENNNNNKRDAEFITNRSFSFGVKVDEEQTIARSAINTITHDVVLGNNIAFELGFRYAGIGVSGGAVITMRETTGRDTVTTNDKSTTVGYHLEDDDPGDYYSVNIKRDSVYGTPVFDLVAGANSCPPEQGAQKRDLPQIISGGATFNNWDPNIENFFTITLANKSESGEARKYNLSVDAVSAQDLQITANGTINLVGTQVAYQIPYGQSTNVQIGVRRPNPNDKRFSFPNVLFSLADNCGFDNLYDPNIQNIAKYSFNYASACGSIALDAPLDGWVINNGSSNSLPIAISGYTLANVDSITLQYAKKTNRAQVWQNGFTIKKDFIPNPANFTLPWNVASLEDTVYSIRLRMVCQNQNIIYSSEASGVIDRKAPFLLGSPQPISELYNPEVDKITFSFSDNIDKTNINSGTVEMMRRSNNSIIPVTVNEDNGNIIITPLTDLGNTVDSFRVIVKNISDLFGNVKTKPDTSYFKLDLTPLVSNPGSNVATVFVIPATIEENSTGKMQLHFRLKEKATKITKLYFNISGAALYNTDYTIAYDSVKRKICTDSTGLCKTFVFSPAINNFEGASGYVYIDSNSTESIIYIDPTEDSEAESDETIRVQLVPGADYKLEDSLVATATILKSTAPCPPANILYVNERATGNSSGVSWANAMRSLKEAINTTCPGVTQIWVARGTYLPTTNNSRDSAFTMKNNLAIYGGFAGTETLLSQRNIRINPTILSGDIGTLNNNSDNAYNVVRNDNNGLNNTAILDGFTITGGNANKGTYIGNRGGGVNNYLSTPSFYNCIITANNAVEYGGGMFNQGTSPLVVNSVFAGNTALYGGGLYNESAATKLINCSFSGNLAFADGGAISTYGAVVPQITNSILWGNSTSIRNAGGSTPAVSYSIVQGGYAGTGNLNTDPLFIFQSAQGLGNTANLRLQGCSPAINVGNNAALPGGISSDLASGFRIINTTIDMGAYERQSSLLSTIIYVDSNAVGNNSGESWANAYINLGSALTELNFCGVGTTIQIARGTYFAPVNTTYNLDKLGASMLGGYPSGGGSSRNTNANPVIIRGNVQVLKSVIIDGIRLQKQ